MFLSEIFFPFISALRNTAEKGKECTDKVFTYFLFFLCIDPPHSITLSPSWQPPSNSSPSPLHHHPYSVHSFPKQKQLSPFKHNKLRNSYRYSKCKLFSGSCKISKMTSMPSIWQFKKKTFKQLRHLSCKSLRNSAIQEALW